MECQVFFFYVVIYFFAKIRFHRSSISILLIWCLWIVFFWPYRKINLYDLLFWLFIICTLGEVFRSLSYRGLTPVEFECQSKLNSGRCVTVDPKKLCVQSRIKNEMLLFCNQIYHSKIHAQRSLWDFSPVLKLYPERDFFAGIRRVQT